MSRSELLNAAEKGKEEFYSFFSGLEIGHNETILVAKKKSNRMVSTLNDILQELNKNQIEQIWSNVFVICTEVLKDYARAFNSSIDLPENEDRQKEKFDRIYLELLNIVALCIAALQLDSMNTIPNFIKTVSILHTSMLNLNSAAVSKKLCEMFLLCWQKELPNKEGLIINPLIYLLSSYLEVRLQPKQQSKIALIEICNFQKAIASLDLSEEAIAKIKDIELKESVVELRQLLISCSLHPGFLKGATGRKFVAHVMLIHTDVMKCVHRAISANIPKQTNFSYLEGYGYIYHIAWMLGSDDFKLIIEEFGIQDIMYCSLHSPRQDPNIFSLYHPILKGIIEHKSSLQVHHMLTRLYNPIIWRALKARNAMVRANAAEILFDVFPLTFPTEGGNQSHEREQFIVKQINAIKDLVNDNYPQVRCVAILGLCRTLEIYWDIIPSKCIAELLQCVFKTCAFDSSSVHVRESVFKGTIILLRNLCAHPVLKKLLPSVGQCLHDTSEKVRISFVDMLLEVKEINMIAFWKICPVENLLAQLEVENKAVSKRLVNLLHGSYLPQPMDFKSWTTRMLCFLKHNIIAARKFYLYCNKLTAKECGLFINEICCTICGAIGNQQEENVDAFNDPNIIAGFLEVICVLWKTFETNLAREMKNKASDKEGEDLRLIMKKLTVKTLPQMTHMCFREYHDERCLNALLLISSYLHPSSIPIFSKGIIPKLRDLPELTSSSYYSMLIKCIGEWGWNKELLELICEWMKTSLIEKENTDSALSKTKSRRSSKRLSKKPKPKSVQFNVEKRDSRPDQALNYLSILLENNMRTVYASEPCRQLLFELIDHFKKIKQEIETKLHGQPGKYTKWNDSMLFRALAIFCKLLSSMHLSLKATSENEEDVKECAALIEIYSLIDWCEKEVIGSLSLSSQLFQDQSLSTSLITAPSSQQVLEQMSLAKMALDVCFPALLHLIESGVPVKERILQFLEVFLETGTKVVDYIGFVLAMFDKLHRGLLTLNWAQSDQDSFSKQKENMLASFDLILVTLMSYSRKSPEGFHQSFKSEIRGNLLHVLQREFQLSSGLTKKTYHHITTKLISSILSDLHHHICNSQTFHMNDSIADLPEYCSCVLPVVLGTSAECDYIFSNTIPQIVEESESSNDIIKPCISLLHTLQKDCKNKSAAKLCYDKLLGNHKIFADVLTEVNNELANNSGLLNDSIA